MEKDFNEEDLRSLFIPAEELGMSGNLNDYTIDANYWFEEMYQMYKDNCHSNDCLDPRQSVESYRKPEELDELQFTAMGRVGYFRWYALTTYYDESVHKMDDLKRQYNQHHHDTACNPLMSDPGTSILHAINNDKELVHFLRHNPIVGNVSECHNIPVTQMFELETRLSEFLDQGIAAAKIFKPTGDGRISIDTNLVRGKDVILPYVWLDKNEMTSFGIIARNLIRCGASTVLAICGSKIIPTTDGKEIIGKIPSHFRPVSYAPRIGLSFSDLIR